MPDKRRFRSSPVRRITIDEKLSNSLMRILVAELKTNITEFDDDSSYWREEIELLVQPDNFMDGMGMTPSDARRWSWDSLFEGQTFLQGYFKAGLGRRDKPGFLVNTGRRNFQCINDRIKENIKDIYFSALKGRVDNGK